MTLKPAYERGDLDSDGYPTEATLERIKSWPHDDWPGLFAFMKSVWWAADWGWHEEPGATTLDKPCRKFHISTAGWRGNEDVIRALRENWLFWARCWEQSRRGGHYIFELTE